MNVHRTNPQKTSLSKELQQCILNKLTSVRNNESSKQSATSSTAPEGGSVKSKQLADMKCGILNCKKPVKFRCSTCKHVWYCSKEHQTVHSMFHGTVCLSIARCISTTIKPPSKSKDKSTNRATKLSSCRHVRCYAYCMKYEKVELSEGEKELRKANRKKVYGWYQIKIENK